MAGLNSRSPMAPPRFKSVDFVEKSELTRQSRGLMAARIKALAETGERILRRKSAKSGLKNRCARARDKGVVRGAGSFRHPDDPCGSELPR